MNAEEYEQVYEAFRRCRGLEGDARRAFLDKLSEANGALRGHVEALLGASEDPGAGLEIGAGAARWLEGTTDLRDVSAALDRVVEPDAPESVGPFRIVRLIGEGGMGRVYEAEQQSPRRRVALKLVAPRARSESLMQRFELEVDVLARLQHPSIAQIFECGEYDGEYGPQPYFAMELVDGVDVRTYAERAQLDLNAKLALVAEIADAIEHAHTKGVIHRDLKPDNVLVGENGRPKVLDFGIARVTDDSTLMRTAVTEAGQLIGTLNYMAPEQLGGDSTRIDAGADVYALGVILFELLSGRRPHEVSGLALTAAIRIVAEEEAPRLGRLAPGIAHDVETIVQKALEKERDRRYATAGALADDLRRFANHQPITARPPSAVYLARRFAQRHRGAVLGLTVAFVALTIGLVLTTRFGLQAQRDRAVAERESYRSAMTAASSTLRNGDPAISRGHLDSVPLARRGWEWDVLAARAAPKYIDLPNPSEGPIFAAAYAHDRPVLAVMTKPVQDAEAVTVWILERGSWTVVDSFRIPMMWKLDLAFREGDEEIVIAGNSVESQTSQALTWNLDQGRVVNRATLATRPMEGHTLSPEGSRVALEDPLNDDGVTVYICDVHDTQTGERIYRSDNLAKDSVTFGAGGRLLSGHGKGQFTRVVDLGTGEDCWPKGAISGQATISAFASRLVVPTHGGVNEVWDLEPELVRVARFRGNGTFRVSPDGGRIARTDQNGALFVVEVDTLQELGPFGSGGSIITPVLFSSDGKEVLALRHPSTPRIWKVDASVQHALVGHTTFVYGVVAFDDPGGVGQVLISSGWDGWGHRSGCVRIWDVRTGAEIGRFGRPNEIVQNTLCAVPGTTDLVVARSSVHTQVGEFGSVERLTLDGTTKWSWPQRVKWMAIEPTGERIAAVSKVGVLRVLDAESGDLLVEKSLDGHYTRLRPVAFDPSGRSIALVRSDDAISILRASDLSELLALEKHPGWIEALTFGSDGTLWSACQDGVVRGWNIETGACLATLDHGRGVLSVSPHPDGTRIATGALDGGVHVWDTETLSELVRFDQHESYVKHLRWSPDGQTLFTPSGDSTVGVWSAQTGLERQQARQERERIVAELEPRLAELLGDARDLGTARANVARQAELSAREREVVLQLYVGQGWARKSQREAE